jgi:phosphopantothenoylcysteine decarboxylase / phosphopantothenate---cysteine ligase
VRLLLGVSGGIAAYKAAETVRLAVKAGHSVRVIQTPTSEKFVGAATFAAITGAPVLTSEFETDPSRGVYPGEPQPEYAPISHLALVERADVYLIAPASANTIAKLAAGFADNLVTTAALAAACPVVVAPAMNSRMYLNPATQENLRTLSERGVTVIPPEEGELASHGERGIGRLPEPASLLAACERIAAHDVSWNGLKVFVTAGGTREPIDSVRYIGNRSSGRMGYALAERASARGAAVTVAAANVALADPPGVTVLKVSTAAELEALCQTQAPSADVVLMAAAVADFRPAAPAAHKLKKTSADAPRSIELEPTADILTAIAANRRAGQTIVGFAAEHGDGALAYGREKLARKQLDAVVVNDISVAEIGFDASENEVVIVSRDGFETNVARAAKETVADEVLNEVARLRTAGEGERDGTGTRLSTTSS